MAIKFNPNLMNKLHPTKDRNKEAKDSTYLGFLVVDILRTVTHLLFLPSFTVRASEGQKLRNLSIFAS